MRCANLLLALALAGCSTTRPLVVQERPPASLLQACPSTDWRPKTNGELLSYAIALRAFLAACNDDKTALREWAKEPK